jgi:hypothetical protein
VDDHALLACVNNITPIHIYSITYTRLITATSNLGDSSLPENLQRQP